MSNMHRRGGGGVPNGAASRHVAPQPLPNLGWSGTLVEDVACGLDGAAGDTGGRRSTILGMEVAAHA